MKQVVLLILLSVLLIAKADDCSDGYLPWTNWWSSNYNNDFPTTASVCNELQDGQPTTIFWNGQLYYILNHASISACQMDIHLGQIGGQRIIIMISLLLQVFVVKIKMDNQIPCCIGTTS